MGRVSEQWGEIVPPVHLSTTFERAADGSYPRGRKYARDESPAYDDAEALMNELERGAGAALFASGMAAATAVFQALEPGARVLVPAFMYWGLRRWLLEHASGWGIQTAFYANADLADLERGLACAPTRLVWIETPANPTWELTDIEEAARIAHRFGAVVVADSTVATPVLTRPLELGADIVMHSATKYLNGHSDVIAGVLVTARDDAMWKKLKFVRAMGGATLGPFEAWLLQRGLRTLFVRVAAANRNAQAIAEHIVADPRLERVLYPGLPGHPGHSIARKQMSGGFGAMLSVRVSGGEAAAIAFAGRLKLFKRATSLGAVESLAEHRASIEGPGTPCPADLVRLSIGIEHVADLLDDIEQALILR